MALVYGFRWRTLNAALCDLIRSNGSGAVAFRFWCCDGLHAAIISIRALHESIPMILQHKTTFGREIEKFRPSKVWQEREMYVCETVDQPQSVDFVFFIGCLNSAVHRCLRMLSAQSVGSCESGRYKGTRRYITNPS